MASRLKYGAVLTASCVLLVILIQLWNPYASGYLDWYQRRDRDRMELLKASDEANNLTRLYRDHARLDSLLPRLRGPNQLVVEQSSRAADSLVLVQRIIAEELQQVTPLRSRIGVFIVDFDFAMFRPLERYTPASTKYYYTGVDGAGPYCLAVISLPAGSQTPAGVQSRLNYRVMRTSDGRYIEKSNVLGPCALWAKYGAPGIGTDSWLRAGGYKFASGPASRLWDRWPDRRREMFGRRVDNYPMSAEKCLAGDVAQCTRAVLDSSWLASVPHLSAYTLQSEEGFRTFGDGESGLLAYMEREFGTEKFAQFWRSTDPPEQAFEKAFGTHMGPWLSTWAHTYFGTNPNGPRIDAHSVLLSLLLLAAMIWLSIRLAQRRQVV